MRAAHYTKRGPASEVFSIDERTDPVPGPGEVRVAVKVSAVNPSDTKMRGNFRGGTEMPFPDVIPHQDGTGIIDQVGAGVDHKRIGERVWIYMANWQRPFGTAAHYVLLPAERAVHLPDAASFEDGAKLGIPAMTAHIALFSSGPINGKTVLVQGGAGAVGFYAIQLAKWAGAAKVFATVSSTEQAEQASRAGADVTINRKTEDVVGRIRTEANVERPIDHIVDVDFGANQDTTLAVLADNGVVASYASDAVQEPTLRYFDFAMRNALIQTVLVYAAAQSVRTAAARDIVKLLETGRLIHQRAALYPLEDIADAHETSEKGQSVGKVLIDVAA